MELPFYISFREFEKNYYNNLEKWFEEFNNTNEIDFLKNMADMYKPYLSYSCNEDQLQADAAIKVKNCFFPYVENFGISFNIDESSNNATTKMNNVSEWKTITMMEYAQHILDKINDHFHRNHITLKENESILDYINNYEVIMSNQKTGYCLDFDLHQKTIPFLKAYLPRLGSTVDITLYRNFHFSIVRIADFIDQKLKSVEAFDQGIYSELKSESLVKIHMKDHSFLTVCN